MAVTMPAGGSATGTKIGLHTFTGIYNVHDFGAVGDGVGDDSAAIQAAVNAAYAGADATLHSRAAVYFPPGIYRITQSAVLTPSLVQNVGGIHCFGAGWMTSVLRLSTTSADVWFYDNGATPRALSCTFSDLGFEGLDPATISGYGSLPSHAKGFRLWATTASGAHEQDFKFTRCQFVGLDTVLATAGDNTASECSFVQCKITNIRSVVLSLNNLQSFNHEFHATDIEVVYGDMFKIGVLGGGSIKVYGGSLISASGSGVDTYILRLDGSTGPGATPLLFNGARFELRGDTTNLVSLAALTIATVVFTDCEIMNQGTVAKTNYCLMQQFGRIEFHRCDLFDIVADSSRYTINSIGALFGQNGEILFRGCTVRPDLSEQCSLTGTQFANGLISAQDCVGFDVGARAGQTSDAHDFDLHWDPGTPGQVALWGQTATDSSNPTHPQWRLKTAVLKCPSWTWPTTNESTLKLPKNAIIKNIYLRKPASGTSFTMTTFYVGRNDKSGTPHLASNTDFHKNVHTGDTQNYFYNVGTTVNERTLRLYQSVDGGQPIAGGFVIVEYY